MDADQILVLDAGVIVERGTHDSLLSSGGLYADLWQMQLGSEIDEDDGLPKGGVKSL